MLPLRLSIPSGREARLRYEEDDVVLAVKLQEMFGCQDSPTVLDNRLTVTVELLSPAGRPLQRTRDLGGFWRSSYSDVRREVRAGIQTSWPDNPLEATATVYTKHRSIPGIIAQSVVVSTNKKSNLCYIWRNLIRFTPCLTTHASASPAWQKPGTAVWP